MSCPNFVVGEVRGKLTALCELLDGFAMYGCTCGTVKPVRKRHVLSGKIQSCGCLHKELTSVAAKTRNTKHGKFGTPIYAIWTGMIGRCHNPNSQAYADYGARGIKVCDAWRKFEAFYADMGDAPPGLTLDREKNDLGYSKANCRWVTMKDQQNNKRNNVVLEYRGERHTVTQWAEHLGLDRMKIYGQLRAGWTAERALTT